MTLHVNLVTTISGQSFSIIILSGFLLTVCAQTMSRPIEPANQPPWRAKLPNTHFIYDYYYTSTRLEISAIMFYLNSHSKVSWTDDWFIYNPLKIFYFDVFALVICNIYQRPFLKKFLLPIILFKSLNWISKLYNYIRLNCIWNNPSCGMNGLQLWFLPCFIKGGSLTWHELPNSTYQITSVFCQSANGQLSSEEFVQCVKVTQKHVSLPEEG